MRLLAPRVQPGDSSALPACASLDQFKNFEQRGNEFAVWRRSSVDAFISPSPENAAPARIRYPGLISTALKGWVMGSREKDTDSLIMYDRTLLWLTFGLAAIGFIMVTSASMPIGQRLTNDPFFFAKRDGVYLILAFILAIITLRLPMEFWQRYSATMLLGSIILLMIVLVMGSSVKGASRWNRSRFAAYPACGADKTVAVLLYRQLSGA